MQASITKTISLPKLLVHGYDFTGDEKAVNIHVMNLRRKLDIDCIQTVRGVGYKFESED